MAFSCKGRGFCFGVLTYCLARRRRVLDGTYEVAEEGISFLPLPPPGRDEFERILRRIALQVERLLERRAMDPTVELLAEDQPLLAGLAATSIHSRIATGHRAGQEVLRRGDRIDPEEMGEGAARADCVAGGGFRLHAGVAVPARDRKRLERLCRYVARPPVATERLSRLADTSFLYRLKRRWRDGTTHMVFETEELLEKLVPWSRHPVHTRSAITAFWLRALVGERRSSPESPKPQSCRGRCRLRMPGNLRPRTARRVLGPAARATAMAVLHPSRRSAQSGLPALPTRQTTSTPVGRTHASRLCRGCPQVSRLRRTHAHPGGHS